MGGSTGLTSCPPFSTRICKRLTSYPNNLLTDWNKHVSKCRVQHSVSKSSAPCYYACSCHPWPAGCGAMSLLKSPKFNNHDTPQVAPLKYWRKGILSQVPTICVQSHLGVRASECSNAYLGYSRVCGRNHLFFASHGMS